MVVTKPGLLFQISKDGWARAYDVDTGKVLWKGKPRGQSNGIPAMYESKGRQYVVFMSPRWRQAPAAARRAAASAAPAPTGPYGYIAFALPHNRKKRVGTLFTIYVKSVPGPFSATTSRRPPPRILRLIGPAESSCAVS